jgi:ribosome-associated protein
MIEITPTFYFDETEVAYNFVRAAGPGGQNVNKVATSVQLRFDVSHSASLPDVIKTRLIQLGGSRMTDDGTLIIEARRYRTQDQNRTDALQRLIDLLHKASQEPEKRLPTRPTLASRVRRIEKKKRHSQVKRDRHFSDLD